MLLAIALFAPWWSGTWLLGFGGQGHWSIDVSSGVSGLPQFRLGWLMSIAAWLTAAVSLVTIALMMTLGGGGSLAERISKTTVARISVGTGVVELVATVLFVAGAPRNVSGVNPLHTSLGAGLIIAMTAGVMLIVSGVLLLDSRVRPKPADSAPAAPAPEVDDKGAELSRRSTTPRC